MLQSIHDKAKGILGMIIVAFLALVFGLWGIGDYLGGATEKFAASVDGVEISQSQFEQSLATQRQRMEEMFQGQMPDSPVFEQRMKEQVIEQLITKQVMQKMVDDEGYRVADVVLAQKIKNIEAFQQEGSFDNNSYQAIIQSQGRSVQEFENLYRNDLAIQQLQDAVMRSAIIGEAELNILNKIQQQTREINYLQFDDSAYLEKVNVTEEQIAKYFEDNTSRYMHPEMVSISYVELTADDVLNDAQVDEEEVRRLYDGYVSSLASNEQRKARHILITVTADADADTQKEKKALAKDILAKLESGDSFEVLAKSHSEDPGSAPGGGELGWVSKGMMVPEFEGALFKLKKGEISGLVKSTFGYHIIRLDDIKADNVASFESKQAELTKQLKAQLSEDGFYEKSELMATTAYESDQSLQEVADTLGLSIKSIPAFSRVSGIGVAANAKVRKAAFNDEVISEGRNSDVIEISKTHVLVLRVDTHTEAKAKTLDEVRNVITQVLRTELAREKTMASALEALVKLEQGQSIESKDLQSSAKLNKLGVVKRDDAKVDSQVLREAFTMSKPTADKPQYKVVELGAGAAVIELKSVVSAGPASKEQLRVLAKQFANEQANSDMGAILEHLKSKSKIIRSKEL